MIGKEQTEVEREREREGDAKDDGEMRLGEGKRK